MRPFSLSLSLSHAESKLRPGRRCAECRHTDEITGDSLNGDGADDVGVVVEPLVEVMMSVVAVSGSTSHEGSDGHNSCLHLVELRSQSICEVLSLTVYDRVVDACCGIFCICVYVAEEQ